MTAETETLESILRRYTDTGELPNVLRVKFADAVRDQDDPLHVIPYLAGLGIQVRTPEDFLRINDDPEEEELACFRISEGIAATIASDGLWLVFEVGES